MVFALIPIIKIDVVVIICRSQAENQANASVVANTELFVFQQIIQSVNFPLDQKAAVFLDRIDAQLSITGTDEMFWGAIHHNAVFLTNEEFPECFVLLHLFRRQLDPMPLCIP